MPITWKNVNGSTGAGEAGQLMKGAQQSMNAGLASLRGALGERQDIQDANFQNDRSNNKNSLLDGLSQYKTVEDFQAAQQSGALDELYSKVGQNIDPGVLRNAQQDHLLQLREQGTATRNYEQGELKARLLPVTEQLKVLAQQGDTAGFESLYGAHAEDLQGGGFAADMTGYLKQQQSSAQAEQRDQYRYDRSLVDDERTDADRARSDGARDQADALRAVLRSAGMQDIGSGELGADSALYDEIRRSGQFVSPDLGIDQMNAFDQSLNNVFNQSSSVQGADLRAVQTRRAQVEESGIGNPFLMEEDFNPAEATNELFSRRWKDAGEINPNAKNLVRQALGKGIPLTEDGTTGFAKFTPEMIYNVLGSDFGKWNKFETNALMQRLREYATSPDYIAHDRNAQTVREMRKQTDETVLGTMSTAQGQARVEQAAAEEAAAAAASTPPTPAPEQELARALQATPAPDQNGAFSRGSALDTAFGLPVRAVSGAINDGMVQPALRQLETEGAASRAVSAASSNLPDSLKQVPVEALRVAVRQSGLSATAKRLIEAELNSRK